MKFINKISWLQDYWPLPLGTIDPSWSNISYCALLYVLVYYLRLRRLKKETDAISTLIEKGAKSISFGKWNITIEPSGDKKDEKSS